LSERSPHRLAIGAIRILVAYRKDLEIILLAENFDEIRAELAGGAEHYDTLRGHKQSAVSSWQTAEINNDMEVGSRQFAVNERASSTRQRAEASPAVRSEQSA
jgi:hypothetical protein